MIRAFRIQNLRSIGDTGRLQIRRINVLVGRNSSGKSTILRFLPLLRQSVEQQTRGVMLWYGRLVDFGSFENAARGHDVERGVGFEFEMTLSGRRASVFRRQARLSSKSDVRSPETSVVASLALSANSEGVGAVREVTLKIGDDVVRIDLDRTGEVREVEVLGETIQLGAGEEWWLASGRIMPNLVLLRDSLDHDEDGEEIVYSEPVEEPFRDRVVRDLRSIVHGRTSDERLWSISGRLSYGDAENVKRQLVGLPDSTPAMRERFARLQPDSSQLRSLRRNLLLTRLEQLMEAVDGELQAFSESVRYIEPLRAIAERYYRRQDLAVDEIDSRGANAAMFLSSLSALELDRLQDWMAENVGFSVYVDRGPGHVQVMVGDDTHNARNVADLGFGYSQMLPIVLQLWQASDNADFVDDPLVIAMEQPELHLHPHYQARLAEVLAATTSLKYSGSLSIFVETHSDHMVNRLGSLIADGKLRREDVQIFVVNDDGVGGESSVTTVDFDEAGLLSGSWPLGFFSPGLQ